MIKPYKRNIKITEVLLNYFNLINSKLMQFISLFIICIGIISVFIFKIDSPNQFLFSSVKSLIIVLLGFYSVYFLDLILFNKRIHIKNIFTVFILSILIYLISFIIELIISLTPSIKILFVLRIINLYSFFYFYFIVSDFSFLSIKKSLKNCNEILTSHKLEIIKFSIISLVFFVIPAICYIILRNLFFPDYFGTNAVIILGKIYTFLCYPYFVEYKLLAEKNGEI